MKKTLLILAISASAIAFGSTAHAQDSAATNSEIAKKYATLVYKDYQDAYQDALKLQSSIESFLAKPNEETLDAAKKAWLVSRNSYGQTEAFRFYEGPIDFADGNGNEGPEGRLNAWPMDEAYIDYVKGNEKAGIVNNDGVEITAETLTDKNQADDEAEVATGYHAIEFLLWGQDLSLDTPGTRPASDYADTPENKRRRDYLTVVTNILVEDLQFLVQSWTPGQDNYAKTFTQDEDALSKILTALATLSGFELASERMATALDSGDQEDEHSCFSDNTHNDFIYNQQGVANVFKDAGIYDALMKQDKELAQKLNAQINETSTILAALPTRLTAKS